ncbi:hypothetical protein [Rhodococcus opacus]|uniref:hypothetical protein n=1 Tax=Rhodococcus opacus TaxID=37919 RepID=UPI001F5A34BC|nr:hypothetical protein [Rhodococcus opacus]MDJ0417539.1 hypothetical protein [Rhodococcus opacus]UNN02018.1 hypothetical protein MOO23_06000 [Rhodococcus opacus]UZG58937.1 hypothetical protein ONE62_17275 [Rhodococcus opacus]
MSIRISSNTPEDEPGNTLFPVRDRIDEDLRTHPAVRLASEAVPLMHRTTAGERFGPVRLIERDSDFAVVFAADTTRWAVLVRPGKDSPEASVIIGVPNPRVGFGRSFRASYLERLNVHQSGDPSVAKETPEFGWMALAGIAAEGVSQFEVRSSLDTDTGGVGADDGVVFAVLRARWREKLHVTVTLASGETVPIHHPSLRPERLS